MDSTPKRLPGAPHRQNASDPPPAAQQNPGHSLIRADTGLSPWCCGLVRHGAAIAGGMHHAMAAHVSGFGAYNDFAVAISWLLGQGAERIAYVDIDAHYGDRVQAGPIRGC